MRVLVVDDGADIRFLIRTVLALAGHQVEQAGGGAEALALLAPDPTPAGLPSVVILDVQMPGMDGWDTLRAIRSNPRTAEVRVILCTVKGRPEDIALGWELGCDGYLNKPFGIDELRDEVATVAGRGREERLSVRESAFSEARRRLGEPAEEAAGAAGPVLLDGARPEARAR
ncbi:MAG: response regulator [Actinomycetota bacterium]